MVTARWVDKRALGFAGRAGGEQDRRIVLGRDFGQGRVVVRVLEQAGASAVSSGCSTAMLTIGAAAADSARCRLARAASAMISAGSVSSQRMLQLVALPPAVEQGRDRARLDDRHVGDDPARAVAHGDADAVALGDPATRPRPCASSSDNPVEVGEGQPLVARDQRFARRHRARRRCAAAPGIGRREIADDRPALGRRARSPAARRGRSAPGEDLVELAVEIARHRTPPLPFAAGHLMRR